MDPGDPRPADRRRAHAALRGASRRRASYAAARHVEPAAEPGGVVELRHRHGSRAATASSTSCTAIRATYAPIYVVDAARPRSRGSALELFGWVLPLAAARRPSNTRGGDAVLGRCSSAHGVDTEVYRIPGNYPVPESTAKVLSGHGDGRHARRVRHVHAASPTTASRGARIRRATSSAVTVQDLRPRRRSPTPCAGDHQGPARRASICQPGQAPGPSQYLTEPRHRAASTPSSDTAAGPRRRPGRALMRAGRVVGTGCDARVPRAARRASLDLARRGALLSPRSCGRASSSTRRRSTSRRRARRRPSTSPDSCDRAISTPQLGQFYTQGMPEETNALTRRRLHRRRLPARRSRSCKRTATRDARAGARPLRPGRRDVRLPVRHRPPVPHALAPRRSEGPGSSATRRATRRSRRSTAHYIEHFYEDVDAVLGSRAPAPAGGHAPPRDERPRLSALHAESSRSTPGCAICGYLVLKDGKRTGRIGLADVDWAKSCVIGPGFNGFYLNLAGREAQGERRRGGRSRRWPPRRATRSTRSAIRRAARASSEAHLGRRGVPTARASPRCPTSSSATRSGYACSDPSTLGEIGEEVLEDNTGRWSGNHLIDPSRCPARDRARHRRRLRSDRRHRLGARPRRPRAAARYGRDVVPGPRPDPMSE